MIQNVKPQRLPTIDYSADALARLVSEAAESSSRLMLLRSELLVAISEIEHLAATTEQSAAYRKSADLVIAALRRSVR